MSQFSPYFVFLNPLVRSLLIEIGRVRTHGKGKPITDVRNARRGLGGAEAFGIGCSMFPVLSGSPKLAFFVWREGLAELRMVHTGNF